MTAIAIYIGITLLMAVVIIDRWRIELWKRRVERKIGGKVVPYWRSIQNKLIDDLTHPHAAAERVDELLQLLKNNPEVEMADEDRDELLEGLARRAAGDDPKIGERERRKALLMPHVMEEVQAEAANPNPISDVQLVGLKKTEDE